MRGVALHVLEFALYVLVCCGHIMYMIHVNERVNVDFLTRISVLMHGHAVQACGAFPSH